MHTDNTRGGKGWEIHGDLWGWKDGRGKLKDITVEEKVKMYDVDERKRREEEEEEDDDD